MLIKVYFNFRNHTAVLLLIFSIILVASSKETCKCWNNFVVNKDQNGNQLCKNTLIDKEYPCGLEQPPNCVCKHKATQTYQILELGYLNCFRGNPGEFVNFHCDKFEEWDSWFNRNPQYRLYD